MDVGGTRGLFTTGRCALSMDWGDIGTLTPGHLRAGQDRRDDHAGLEGSPRPRDRQARALRRDDLPERRRRRQLRPVRLVRRLVGRGQRGRPEGEPGRRLRLPVVHERAGASRAWTSRSARPATTRTGRRTSRTSSRGSTPASARPPPTNYLGAIKASLENTNMVLDMRIPLTKRYEQDVLDTAVVAVPRR